MKPIEEHLADFILRCCKGPMYREYRRQCMAKWLEVYGEQVALRVEKMVRAEYQKRGKKTGKNGD